MVLDVIWQLFEEQVFHRLPAGSRTRPQFNFYLETNMNFDQSDAGKIRQDNLASYLASHSQRPSTLLLGEAPGWRGCRFSGVPFTSESQLVTGELPFSGKSSSLDTARRRKRETTATIFWKAAAKFHRDFFVWNVIPYHLHQPDRPLSNRPPTRAEINEGLFLLDELIVRLQPAQVIAIGRAASFACVKLGIHFSHIRHPSHGGAGEFTAGLERLMREDRSCSTEGFL